MEDKIKQEQENEIREAYSADFVKMEVTQSEWEDWTRLKTTYAHTYRVGYLSGQDAKIQKREGEDHLPALVKDQEKRLVTFHEELAAAKEREERAVEYIKAKRWLDLQTSVTSPLYQVAFLNHEKALAAYEASRKP